MTARELGHHGRTNVWLTPRPLLEALGPFDLDPCAAPAPRPWPTAARHYDLTQFEDGLNLPWFGQCWVNPPYGPHANDWLARLAEHGTGIALTFARTETEAFFRHVWAKSAGVLFVKGRLRFCTPDGVPASGAAAPSILIAYGDEALRRLATRPIAGHLVVHAGAFLVMADGAPVGTWREAVSAAGAGRTLRLRDLYRAAEGTPKVREAKARGHNWQAQIRRALQVYFAPDAPGVWRTA